MRVIFIQLISINPKYDERNRIREIRLMISMVSFKVVDQCRVTKYFENYSSLSLLLSTANFLKLLFGFLGYILKHLLKNKIFKLKAY